jgi:hypothetical protein
LSRGNKDSRWSDREVQWCFASQNQTRDVTRMERVIW